ncbi:MAG: GEVED domain-containing protein [Bacteroidota bacterium]
MKTHIGIIFTLVLLSTLSASAQVFDWVAHAGGTYNDRIKDICADDMGNVYALGYYSDSLYINDTAFHYHNITNGSCPSVFIARFNGDGSTGWIKAAGRDDAYPYITGDDICTDSQGNVYVAGGYRFTVYFDGTALYDSLTSSQHIYLAKYNSGGNLLWVKSFNSPDNDYVTSMDIDDNDMLYLTGYFYDSLIIDASVLVSSGAADLWMAKFDSDGNSQWARNMGSGSNEVPASIKTDETGNSYIAASGTDPFTIDGFDYTGTGNKYFILKVDNSTGSVVWLKDLQGTGNSEVRDIDIHPSGDLILVGKILDTVYFDTMQFVCYNTMHGDAFIARMDGAGNFIWAGMYTGNGFGKAMNSVSVDPDGNPHVTGYFSGNILFPGFLDNDTLDLTVAWWGEEDIFYAKFDDTGKFLLAEQMGCPKEPDFGMTIDADSLGNIFSGGYFTAYGGPLSITDNLAYFDTIVLTTYNNDYVQSEDAYVMKFRPCEPGDEPVASFTPTAGSDNTVITFQNTSLNGKYFRWDFGDGGTSVEENPVHDYAGEGFYDVTLKVYNNCNMDSASAEVKIYCFPNTTSTTACYIDGIELEDIDNTGNGYSTFIDFVDYTGYSTVLHTGQPYTMACHINTDQGNVAAWIDYNDDGDFNDANEKLGEVNLITSAGVYNLNFTVPSNPVLGSLRLRVRSVYGTQTGLLPCNTYGFGETEEYTVILENPTHINNVTVEQTIKIYPNPTLGEIMVEADKIESIEILNMQGRQIYYGKENRIDLGKQSGSIYFIKVTTDEGVVIEKVILQ